MSHLARVFQDDRLDLRDDPELWFNTYIPSLVIYPDRYQGSNGDFLGLVCTIPVLLRLPVITISEGLLPNHTEYELELVLRV